jgi:hypothetical protein
MIAALVTDATNLFLALCLAGAITGCGLFVLHRTDVVFASGGLRLFYAFAVGASVTGYAVFTLALIGLLYPVTLLALLALLLGGAAAGWRAAWRVPLLFHGWRPSGWVEQAAALLLLLLLAAGLILTLAPETGRDALVYHLTLPKLFREQHGFFFVPGNIYANFPLHTEMLYLLALFLKGDVVARLLHFIALLVVLLGIGEIARERRGASPTYPYLSMLLFASLPTVFYLAHMAYIDLFVTLYTLGALLAYLSWRDGGGRGWLFLSALCSGTAMACKYTALFLPLLGVLGILWVHRAAEKADKPLGDLGRYLWFTALFGAPFYLKAWVVTGNPFYPFFYGLFGGRGWEPRQAELFEGLLMFFGMGRSPLDYLLLPWNLSFHAEMHTRQFDGVIGPLFLLVLPFLAGLRPLPSRLLTMLAFAGLTFLFWTSGSQQLRFLIPIFPVLAVAGGCVLAGHRHRKAVFPLLLLVVSGCLVFNGTHLWREFTKIGPIGVVTGSESREEFLSRSVTSYAMYRYVNEHLPGDARIFLVGMKNMTFHCERDTYADTMFETYTLGKILASSRTPEEVLRALQARGFTHILYDDRAVLGDKSLFEEEEKTRFVAFRDKYLTTVNRDDDYFLCRL